MLRSMAHQLGAIALRRTWVRECRHRIRGDPLARLLAVRVRLQRRESSRGLSSKKKLKENPQADSSSTDRGGPALSDDRYVRWRRHSRPDSGRRIQQAVGCCQRSQFSDSSARAGFRWARLGALTLALTGPGGSLGDQRLVSSSTGFIWIASSGSRPAGALGVNSHPVDGSAGEQDSLQRSGGHRESCSWASPATLP